MTTFYITYLVLITLILLAHMVYMSSKTTLTETITHPGTIVLGFFYLYCLIPTLFFVSGVTEGAPFRWDQYSDEEIKSHLLRSLVFAAILVASINLVTSKKQKVAECPPIEVGFVTVFSCIAIFFASNLILLYLSAEVDSYYDFYTRFDHLSGFSRIVSVVCKRLIWGITPISIFVLSIYYINNPRKYILSVSIIILFIILNSYGARIDAILAVIQALCYRLLWVRKSINKYHIIAVLPVLALSMYALRYIEVIRLGAETQFELTLANALLVAPGEFFALMFPSIELYRIITTESVHGFTMYFKDILAIIPFLDVGNFDLMYWYWKTFAPSAPVAPFTMGVLADPAILGDWWLVVEAVVIGRFAVLINNQRYANNAYRMAAYGYLASNGVLVLKYNMLTYVDMLINNFLLGAFLLWLIMMMQRGGSIKASSRAS